MKHMSKIEFRQESTVIIYPVIIYIFYGAEAQDVD